MIKISIKDAQIGMVAAEPVSYTHLDVYKRQVHGWAFLGFMGIILQLLSCFAIRGRESVACPPGLCDLRPLRCGWF